MRRKCSLAAAAIASSACLFLLGCSDAGRTGTSNAPHAPASRSSTPGVGAGDSGSPAQGEAETGRGEAGLPAAGLPAESGTSTRP
jgi:hypothetical protein